MKQNVAIEKSQLPWLLRVGAFSNVSRNGLLVLTAIVLVVAGVDALAFSRWQQETRLDRAGTAVEGTVTDKRVEEVQRSRGGPTLRYHIGYRYEAYGSIHNAEQIVSSELYNDTQSGNPISVTILPDDPTNSRVEPEGSGFQTVFRLLSAFLAILGFIWFCNAFAFLTLPDSEPVLSTERSSQAYRARSRYTS